MLKFLLREYPFLEDQSHRFWITIGVSLFVFIFLWVFKPFGISEFERPTKWVLISGSSLICFLIIGLNHFLLPFLFPGILRDEGWTVGKHIVWLWWQVFSTGVGIYFLALAVEVLTPGIKSFTYMIGISIAIGLFPVSGTVFASQIILEKKRKIRAENITRNIQKPRSDDKETLLITSENKGEKLKIIHNDFIYAQSKDNYVYVCYRQVSKIQGKMLRSSLRRVERQITAPLIVRCHRSFIVNLNQVKKVTGNAQGYKLILEHTDAVIPVSRSRHEMVLSKLSTF